MSKSNLMLKAHKIAKTLEGNYSARLSLALKMVWAEIKGGNKMLKRLNATNGLVENSVVVDFVEYLGMEIERWQVIGMEGTEKQISWATSIALDRIKETNSKLIGYAKKGAPKEKLQLVMDKLVEKLENNEAKYWIDTRNISIDKFLLA